MFSNLPQIRTNSLLFPVPFSLPHNNTFRVPSHLSLPCTKKFRPFQVYSLPTSNHFEPLPDNQSKLKEAQKAISVLLQEFGVSEEESLSIASNSPRYLRMLIDGVQDLDELSMWDSFKADLQEKVLHLARQKGDNGKVAYLESLGFTISSAMNVARYLSAETLPTLIHKVKCTKEILFSVSENYEFPVRNVRRMTKQLSIPIDEDIQHTLSFFEKVEAKRGGLNMLAIKDVSFHYLIESFPRILLLSVKYHIQALVEFLESIGIPRDRIRNIILVFPPVLLWNAELLKTRVLALKQIGIMDKDFAKVILKYPWILSTSIQDNYREFFSLFDLEKVPKAYIDRAIKSWPHILGCSTSKLKVMVDQFSELGVQDKKLGRIIAKSPQILLQQPQSFLQVVLFFENMGFDKENIGRIFVRCPEIFAASISKTLQRKIEFLSSVGVSEDHLPRVIRKYPELLLYDPDRTLLPRMMYLMKLGLSKRDIAFMVRTFSPLFGYSIEEVLKPKIEFLVYTMGRPVKDVVGYPRYFSYSLEKRIMPRFWVLKGMNTKCSLKDMLGKNDDEFAAEYMGAGVPPPPLSGQAEGHAAS